MGNIHAWWRNAKGRYLAVWCLRHAKQGSWNKYKQSSVYSHVFDGYVTLQVQTRGHRTIKPRYQSHGAYLLHHKRNIQTRQRHRQKVQSAFMKQPNLLQSVQEGAVSVSAVSFSVLDTRKPKSFTRCRFTNFITRFLLPTCSIHHFCLTTWSVQVRRAQRMMGMHGPDGNCCYHFPPLCFTTSEISDSLKTSEYRWRNRDATVTVKLTIKLHHHQAEASSADPGLSLRFQAVNDIKNTQNWI